MSSKSVFLVCLFFAQAVLGVSGRAAEKDCEPSFIRATSGVRVEVFRELVQKAKAVGGIEDLTGTSPMTYDGSILPKLSGRWSLRTAFAASSFESILNSMSGIERYLVFRNIDRIRADRARGASISEADDAWLASLTDGKFRAGSWFFHHGVAATLFYGVLANVIFVIGDVFSENIYPPVLNHAFASGLAVVMGGMNLWGEIWHGTDEKPDRMLALGPVWRRRNTPEAVLKFLSQTPQVQVDEKMLLHFADELSGELFATSLYLDWVLAFQWDRQNAINEAREAPLKLEAIAGIRDIEILHLLTAPDLELFQLALQHAIDRANDLHGRRMLAQLVQYLNQKYRIQLVAR